MRRKTYFWGFLFLILAVSLFGEEFAVGYLKAISGTAQIVRQGENLEPRIGDKVFKNDVLRTGPNSSLGITFKDDTLLSLGPNSQVVVNDFAFSPAEGKLSFAARILKGTVVYLSGIIGKLAPDAARLQTPYANIGFRGTRVAVQIEGEAQHVIE